MRIDKLAVWINTIGYPSDDLVAFARRLEGWGYGTLWINDGMGSDPMVLAAKILARTERLQVALGVANIYSRDPTMMLGAQYGLNEQWGGRFLLGLGASHQFIVEGMRGHTAWGKPVATMRAYLEAMAGMTYAGPPPAETPKTVIAALGPKMLELARDHADGAHPFATTPEHTAMARGILGPGKLLLVEQKILLETDAEQARTVGRGLVAGLAGIPNYRNSLLRMGFSEDELGPTVSDRVADALVAWGDAVAIGQRIEAHWDAGADQVAVQVMPKDGGLLTAADEVVLERLAPLNRAA
ncbi:TIGR03620 family F420-dependent LLM class oxidoreductase [Novosphingobium sp. JCM 18896]|uniref:TIGR03620 family F420-dependent LLM class oxidoreductase n=1 Tax=Novosphingobium sp. JCM 18896 TaxID=2989731 RepID=UPI00222354B5|nr:TIGR03620 family F420-dependent LLM class oxidoreductase [Novosphingobium sp. JCM 18896]MCW1429960.1 TIGR03620 family F420-dependent LLM class oxidoreductase [Novosphingobium sp. JCM 18896]